MGCPWQAGRQAGKPASGFLTVHGTIRVYRHESKLCFHWRIFQNEPRGISRQQKKARKSKLIGLGNMPHSWSSRHGLMQLKPTSTQTLWIQQKSLISFYRNIADWQKTCTGNQLKVGRGRSRNKSSVPAFQRCPRWLVVVLVGSCWGCAILYVFQVTGVTKQMFIQGVAAMPVFVVQFHPTVLQREAVQTIRACVHLPVSAGVWLPGKGFCDKDRRHPANGSFLIGPACTMRRKTSDIGILMGSFVQICLKQLYWISFILW